MMVNQVSRLEAAVRSATPWLRLVNEFPSLHEVALQMGKDGYLFAAAPDKLVALYRQYVDEWNDFPPRPPRHPLYLLSEHGVTHGG
jgi:hypothetical protein